MKLILLGPPGSGKGTISELLSKNFKLLHVSPGELLREEVRKETAIGKEIKKYIEKGHLVPAQLVVEFVKLEVRNKKNFILDGFPRSIDQAKAIEDLGIDYTIYLNLEEKDVIKRLSGRRVCAEGKHNYHLLYLPPQKKGICDIDGSRLMQRKDDTPSVIKERFKVFDQETKPVITYYQKKGTLKIIDASGNPEDVYERILKLVQGRQRSRS